MVADLQELQPISAKLNAKSDQINTITTTVNMKLQKPNLGLEVWLDSWTQDVLRFGDWESEPETGNRSRDVTYLGYDNVVARERQFSEHESSGHRCHWRPHEARHERRKGISRLTANFVGMSESKLCNSDRAGFALTLALNGKLPWMGGHHRSIWGRKGFLVNVLTLRMQT